MTKYEYKQRRYSCHTHLDGTTNVTERWEEMYVFADHCEVTDYGALRFFDEPHRLVAAEPPHAWCELRGER